MTLKLFAYLLAIGIPLTVALYQYSVIKYEDSQIKALEFQIIELKRESTAAIARSDTAARFATEEMKRLQNDAQRIMDTPVSKKCKEAMAWSVQQTALLQ